MCIKANAIDKNGLNIVQPLQQKNVLSFLREGFNSYFTNGEENDDVVETQEYLSLVPHYWDHYY